MSPRSMVGFAFAAALVGCSSKPAPPPNPLVVTTTLVAGAIDMVPDAVKADGTIVATVQIAAATKGPIRVITTRGVFANGSQTVNLDLANPTVGLVACNAKLDPDCPGSVTISAYDGNLAFGQTTLTFLGFETSCSDGKDNNGDKVADCADPDCANQGCVGAGNVVGVCMAKMCRIPVCEPLGEVEVCGNNLDDDCDGGIDCAAASCDGQACKPGFPSYLCRASVCTDISSGIAVTVTPARNRVPADGATTTPITIAVTKMGVPEPDIAVEVSASMGLFVVDGATVNGTVSLALDASGTGIVNYRSDRRSGTSTIRARLKRLPEISGTALVTMPALGSINLGTVQHQVMGVKYSGSNEQNQITVQVLDTDQRPYPDGLAIRFEHQQLGGSTISTPVAADTDTCLRANGCLGYIGRTASPAGMPDTTGVAGVNFASGTAAGPISIAVSATAGEMTRTYTIQNIAVVGAKASGAHVSLLCTPLNLPGFVNSDCSNSFYSDDMEMIKTIKCTVFLADRFNNVLGVATRADFRSEAGSAGPPVLTKAYDPVRGGDQTAELGHAVDSVQVTGYRLPTDVEPASGEYSREYETRCGIGVHNPRDGFSTVIVAVQGEEGFVDLNGNGVYDKNEPFVDAGEPFVDENDNNVRDNDESFIDVNQNNVWDPANGVWDADTVVWAETRVLYTDAAIEARWMNLTDTVLVPGETPGVTLDVAGEIPGPATSQTFGVYFSDPNFNPLFAFTDYNIEPLGEQVKVKSTRLPSMVESLGASFTQQYCDREPPIAATACFATCKAAPCYRVTRISNYQYGSFVEARITGKTAGFDTVRAAASVTGQVTSTTISGSVQ